VPSHFLFYGGKGGVGKTTCAAAHAVAAARTGSRVFVVSTDPAHSLGDALAVRLSSRVTTIAVGSRATGSMLQAAELDAPRAFGRWLRQHRPALGDIVEHGTWLDRDDVEALLGLSLPGIDELAGILEIVRLASSRYDLIVVDTAPTGHMLRLLAAPETVGTVADVLDVLQQEHRVIREQLARVRRPEAADRLIALLAEQAADTRALLRDPARSTVHWVMLPEELSLAETGDALAVLDAAGIPVRSLVVNCVTPDGPPCRMCDGRRAAERQVLDRVAHLAARRKPKLVLHLLSTRVREPRGVNVLAQLSRSLLTPFVAARASHGRAVKKTIRPVSKRAGRELSIPLPVGAKLLFLGGKGGVGKTTAAAVVAMRLARDEPRKQVLLISTDPAHSLADVFDHPLGDEPVRIPHGPPNLHVRELDATRALAARRGDLEAALEQIGAAAGAGLALSGGAASGLIDLAPPGIDELFGLVSILEPGPLPYDLIVIDTAPTGHALRLLEMPEIAREWVGVLLRVLLKYRDLVRPGRLATELVDISKSIRAVQALMRDPRRAHFLVVSRAAVLPRLETERLLDRLRRLHLDVPLLIVNALTVAPGRCVHCRATAAAERRELPRLKRVCRRRFPECAIIQTPLIAPPPRGVAALERWARDWVATNDRKSR